jgi:hypothetical protein
MLTSTPHIIIRQVEASLVAASKKCTGSQEAMSFKDQKSPKHCAFSIKNKLNKDYREAARGHDHEGQVGKKDGEVYREAAAKTEGTVGKKDGGWRFNPQ